MNLDEEYMHSCLELAVKGLGHVAPNPMVGCVIAGEDGILGEGYHEKFGDAHAEINALNSIENKKLLKGATLFVNLEPCAHKGKTGPCTEAIIASGIKKVVIGCTDPNPEVNGKGIERLKNAGIEVVTGVLERECFEVNKRFFAYHHKKRPYIILKWAQSADGFIDRKRTAREDRAILTHEEADMMTHLWRSQEQAIMVGTRTVEMDNPELNTRKVNGKSPARVILDRNLRIPPGFKVFNSSAHTIVITEQEQGGNHVAEYIPLKFDGSLLPNILKELHGKQYQSLIVEGGEKLLKSFIDKDLWDEAKIFYSPLKLGEGVKAPNFPFPSKCEIRIGEDTLTLYSNKHK